MPRWRAGTAALLAGQCLACALAKQTRADEGGASVWLPGQFASFASVPGDPGFGFETLYYHRYASATASRSFAVGGAIVAGLAVTEDYVYLTPGYAFAQPVLGGQLYLGATFSPGGSSSSASVMLVGPEGETISASVSDSMLDLSDIYPVASLKWATGPHNFMAYFMGSIPVGNYDPNRIAGLGIGHWAIDGGLGYTFASESGIEASITAGATGNFMNPQTQYQSGVDGHLDWGISYSLTENLYLGAAGYIYHQLGPDSGPTARLGAFRSEVSGAGPQVGYTFTAGNLEIDLNFRGYREFDAQNRPEGFNLWFTVGLSHRHASGR